MLGRGSVHEKRQHPRVVVDLPASMEVDGSEAFPVFLRDASVGGAFLETPETLAFGARVTVIVSLPGLADARLPGIVRWNKPTGLGVQFDLLGARETHALTTLMRGNPR